MKQYIKSVLAVLAAVFVFNAAAMANPFEDFKNNVGAAYLAPFAKDFGGLLGGTDFNSGRAVGFPGFDVGMTLVMQSKPDSANRILKTANVNAFSTK